VFIRSLGVLGLRFGEAAALRRRHVDVLRRRLHIEDSLAEVGGRFVFGPTKSHATRSIPLSRVLVGELERHLDDVDEDPNALVFAGPKGGPLRYRYLYMRLWRPVRLNSNSRPSDYTRSGIQRRLG
jgi:integrase